MQMTKMIKKAINALPPTLLLLQAPALARADSCPISQEEIQGISSSKIESICAAPFQEYQLTNRSKNIVDAIQQCRNSLRLAQETSLVVRAGHARQDILAPQITAFQPRQSKPELLFALHSYANISLAAAYREALKVRLNQNNSRKALENLESSLVSLRSQLTELVKSEGKAKAAGSSSADYLRYKVIPIAVDELLTTEDSKRIVKATQACVDSSGLQLADSFASWKTVKEKLLTSHFEDSVAIKNPGNLTAARNAQAEQKYVYDVLTDAAKRDWAYKLAENCVEASCGTLSILGTITGVVAGAPGISLIAKVLTGGLAADLAKRQGLDFWQQLREAGNFITPFQVGLFDTEIKKIERGETAAFPAFAS